MNRQRLTFFMLLSGILLMSMAFSAVAVPGVVNFQGKLTDANAAPLDGSYDMIFRLYDDTAAGNQLWTESQIGVTLISGMFNVQLGDSAVLEPTSFADNAVDAKTLST